jgi:hypothetical protein
MQTEKERMLQDIAKIARERDLDHALQAIIDGLRETALESWKNGIEARATFSWR